jgi:hypothetical protein
VPWRHPREVLSILTAQAVQQHKTAWTQSCAPGRGALWKLYVRCLATIPATTRVWHDNSSPSCTLPDVRGPNA